jgi:Leucine-rich repeat (LRR) protein
VDHENFVTGLVLLDDNLKGTIPSSIGNLVGLTDLVLSMNKISGTIPESIGQLTNLRQLYLSSNKLTGTIPASIGNLVSIQSLNLNHNSLKGVAGVYFDSCTMLILCCHRHHTRELGEYPRTEMALYE